MCSLSSISGRVQPEDYRSLVRLASNAILQVYLSSVESKGEEGGDRIPKEIRTPKGGEAVEELKKRWVCGWRTDGLMGTDRQAFRQDTGRLTLRDRSRTDRQRWQDKVLIRLDLSALRRKTQFICGNKPSTSKGRHKRLLPCRLIS